MKIEGLMRRHFDTVNIAADITTNISTEACQ